MNKALLFALVLIALPPVSIQAQEARRCGIIDRLRNRCGPSEEEIAAKNLQARQEIAARNLRALNSLEVIDRSIDCDWWASGTVFRGCDGSLIVRNGSSETLQSIGVGWEIHQPDAEGKCPSRQSMATKTYPSLGASLFAELPPGGRVQMTFQVASMYDNNFPRRYSYCLGPSDVRIKIGS